MGWYRGRVETPQEDICFFPGMEWGLGGEGEWEEGVLLGGMEWGTEKFHFLLQIQKQLTKIWKFSPNSKKPKIGQN